MARRRHKLIRSASYYRANPLTDMELAAYGLAGVAVLGLGGYLLYQHFNPAATAATAQLPPSGAQVAAPGTFGSQQPLFDAQGNPIPGAPLQQVGL